MRFGQLCSANMRPKPPKMEPKHSQNPAQEAPKFDVMLRTLKSESEQTLPHFCSFLLIPDTPKSARNRRKNALNCRLLLDSLCKPQKLRFLTFSIWFLGPNLGPTCLYLGAKAAKNKLLSGPCRTHGWSGPVGTQKPTLNETDFGPKWLQIRFQRAPNSART